MMTALALWRLARPYLPIIGALLLIGGLIWLVGHYKGQRDAARAEISAMNEQTKAAAARIDAATRSMAASAVLITKGKNDAILSVTADRDALLIELRARPTRAAASAAGGAADGQADVLGTGAGLFAEDAEFLVREAARADVIRASLMACYAQYDAARAALQGLGEGGGL